MQIQIKHHTLNLDHIISLVRQQHYMEALDRYNQCLTKQPNLLPQILTSLYKELIYSLDNIHIKLLISELYFSQDFYKDCFIELSEIYDIDKSFSQTFFLLNKLYKKTNNKDYIVPIFHDAIEHDIFDSIIIDVLPKIYFDDNNIDASIVLFNKLLTHQPDNEHYYKTLAELYKLNGDYKKTVSIYKSLVETSPHFLLEASITLEELLKLHPSDSSIREQLIDFYMKLNDPNHALIHLEELCKQRVSFRQEASSSYKKLLDHFPAEQHITASYITHLISIEQFTDAIHQLETFYQNYTLHDSFIQNTLLAILTQNPKHQLTILHFIDYSLRHNDFLSIKKWVDCCFELTDIPFNDLIEKLTQALKHPSTETDYFEYQCAKLYYLQHNYQKALEYCLSSRHFSLEKETLKLTILIDKKDFQLAQKSCLALLDKYPFEKEYYDLLQKSQVNFTKIALESEQDLKKQVVLHMQQADYLNTIESAQQFDSTHDDYIYSQLIISRCFFEQGRIDQAQNQISRITIPHQSNHVLFCEILFFKAMFSVFLNDFNQAVNYFEDILHYNINQCKVTSILKQLKQLPLTTTQGETVTCLITPFQQDLFISGIQNSEELFTKQTEAIGFCVSENNTGVRYLFKQNYISALTVFQNAIQLDNQKALVHSNMSVCYLVEGFYDKALESINKAISLNKDNDIYHLNKGLILYKQNQIESALECFQMALKLNSQNYHAIYNLAMLYYKMNRLYLCFKYLEKLDKLGLFYMFLQRQFYFLNQFSKSIYYWATSSFDIIPSHFYKQNEQ